MLKLESVKRMDGKCLKNPSMFNETMDCAADPLLLELQGVPGKAGTYQAKQLGKESPFNRKGSG